jgi:gluconate kinase
MTRGPAMIVVSGIQGAGKSTVGRLLAERFARGAFVDADDLHWMIVSGQAWVTEPGAPIAPEAAAQLRLRLHNACLLARSFYEAGFTAVICDIIIGERMDHLREELRGMPFHLVVLAPDAETVIQREAARGKKTILGPDWAHHLDGELRNTMPGIGLWIDNAHQTAEQTVNEILQRLHEGLIEST